jgi:hypothetical protein
MQDPSHHCHARVPISPARSSAASATFRKRVIVAFWSWSPLCSPQLPPGRCAECSRLLWLRLQLYLQTGFRVVRRPAELLNSQSHSCVGSASGSEADGNSSIGQAGHGSPSPVNIQTRAEMTLPGTPHPFNCCSSTADRLTVGAPGQLRHDWRPGPGGRTIAGIGA